MKPSRWNLKLKLYACAIRKTGTKSTPNIRSEITVSNQKSEHCRFEGSTEGVKGRSKEALREEGEALKEHGGAPKEQRKHYRAMQGRSRWGA